MSDNKPFRSTYNGNIEDVINKDRTAEKVAKRKEDTHAENIEESQKKTVKEHKTETVEPHISLKDSSGRIKYGSQRKREDAPKQTAATKQKKTPVVKPKDTEKSVKGIEDTVKTPVSDSRYRKAVLDKRRDSVINANGAYSEIVKTDDTAGGIIKEENNGGIVKEHQAFADTAKGGDTQTSLSAVSRRRIRQIRRQQAFKYVDTSTSSSVSDKKMTVSVKGEYDYEKSVIKNMYADLLSATGASYIETSKNKVGRSDFADAAHEKIVKSLDKWSKNLNEGTVGSNGDSRIETTSQSKSNVRGVAVYGKEAIKTSVKNSMENSEDEGMKTSVGTFVVADIASAALKKDNRPKIDTKKVSLALGIKSEMKNEFDSMVLKSKNITKAVSNNAVSAIEKSIKNYVSDAAEDNMAFRAVDNAVKTVDTVNESKAAAAAIIHSTRNTAEGIVLAKQGIKNLPQNTKAAYNAFKNKVEKTRKLLMMKNSHKRKLVGKAAGKAAKQAANTVASAVKSAFLKIAALFGILVLIVIICGGTVIAAVCSVLWQTSGPLDTTQIIKHISSLDYDQQVKWFGKGATGVAIEKSNRNDAEYEYKYYLAVDVPDDIVTDYVDENNVNCMVTIGTNSHGDALKPSQRGFNKSFSSKDEMLETYRWTTDDYRAALAYIQIKKENLGWFQTFFSFVGEQALKNEATALHKLTYGHKIVVKDKDGETGEVTYDFKTPIYYKTYRNDDYHYYVYYGRKYSVKYLIDNDMVRFSDDDAENNTLKEQFYNTYKYGNFAVGNLDFPLELEDGEKISDRISKHFGKQLYLVYEPPDPPSDPTDDVYGTVKSKTGYHYANDLSADAGDIFYAPIDGLCIVKQRDGRGFEFTISTVYNGNAIDYTKDGYLVKMSCTSSSFIPANTPTLVHKGDALGKVCGNVWVNNYIPDKDNDSENEDIFADKLFPCCTATAYHTIGANEYEVPEPEEDHLHIEMYKLPCDFSSTSSIEDNVLAPELFFDYSNEVDE